MDTPAARRAARASVRATSRPAITKRDRPPIARGAQLHRARLLTAREIMAAREVPLIDLHAFTAGLPAPLFRDHVHFAPWVSERQATHLRTTLDTLSDQHRGHWPKHRHPLFRAAKLKNQTALFEPLY